MAPIINLCFHGIGEPDRVLEPGEDRYWISRDLYERVLDAVVGRDDVRLSFDDGNASDLEIGLPGLADRGLRATFFVLAGRMGQPGSLDKDAVRKLRDERMSVGSHGMHHISWRGLDEAQSNSELVAARNQIAEVLGHPVDRVALPFGQYDRHVLARLKNAGYRQVCTSDGRWSRPEQWLQPRYSITCEDTINSLKATVLSPRPLAERVVGQTVGLVKRWR